MNRFIALTGALGTLLAAGVAASAPDGIALYKQHCASCHQTDASGVPGTFPPLKSNPALGDDRFVAAVVLRGLDIPITVDGKTYRGQMPAWGDKLSDAEIAAVLSYVRTTFNDHGNLSASTVSAVRKKGTAPQDLLPAGNQQASQGDNGDQTRSGQSRGSDGSEQSNGPGQSGDGSKSGHSTSKTTLGKRTMDSKALKDALKDIRYDPPFPAKIELETGQFAEVAKLGFLIFNDTQHYAAKYVGNGLNCRNCHLQVGAQSGSAPLWGAFPNLPTYRSKNNLVNSFENRVQGCFKYSMNGTAPPASGAVLEALGAYAAWLSQGLPIGVSTEGRGYPEVKDFDKPDKTRGEQLYQAKCAICHGARGQGTPVRGGKGYQFPPLWGPDSYNWGAGMHKKKHFRNFIKGNMPLGQGGSLTDQQAADIAAFVNQKAHARPTRIHNPGDVPGF